MSISTDPVAGILYIVATPIGHLDDISARAITVLRDVELILAEDTRHSKRLLQHYAIRTPVQSCHEHNERDLVAGLVTRLRQGDSMALVSDAGTPLISDPGYHLVAAAHAAGIRVSPVPGPSAVTAALSAAGIATDRFMFVGYLPSKHNARRKLLEPLSAVPETLVIYEAPHRILATLSDLQACFGPARPMTLCRELTKRFETVRHGTVQGLHDQVAADPVQQKGEFVLVLAGAPVSAVTEAEAQRVLKILLRYQPVKTAATIAAEILGESKNRLYELALTLKDD